MLNGRGGYITLCARHFVFDKHNWRLSERETDELTVRSRVNKGAFTCEQASGRLFNRCLVVRCFAPRQPFKRWVHLQGQVQLGVGKTLFIQPNGLVRIC